MVPLSIPMITYRQILTLLKVIFIACCLNINQVTRLWSQKENPNAILDQSFPAAPAAADPSSSQGTSLDLSSTFDHPLITHYLYVIIEQQHTSNRSQTNSRKIMIKVYKRILCIATITRT